MQNEYKLEINVTKDNVTITNKEKIHNGEYKIVECVFTFSEDFDGLAKKAIFEAQDALIEMPITNNKCNIPVEILSNDYFQCNLRVYGYETEEVNGETNFKLRYSPTYDTFPVYKGSYIPDAQGTQEITPTEFEQYSEALNEGLEEVNEKLVQIDNLDINASKVGNTATVTVTKKDGTEQTVQIFDGEQGIQGPAGADGRDGVDGQNGADGRDATINGVNTLSMVAGSNISLSQSGSTLTISATGGGGGGGGTTDYQELSNKPSINSVELSGNKTSSDLGIEDVTNKVTSLSSESTDTQYPSAKCVYDLIGDIETLLEEI